MHLEPDTRPGESPDSGAPASASRAGSSPANSDPSNSEETYAAELRLIVEQAQMLTQASGAAIALRQGELMVCRARAGSTAPDLGALLDTKSGLSGECVRSGKVLVCDDTESDSRVNLDVCRYLGIRSIAVLPILLEREIVGVFEVFAQEPGAFAGHEVAALGSMCELVISVIRPQPKAKTDSQADVVAALSARAAGKPLEAWLAASLEEPGDDLVCEIEQRPPVPPQKEALANPLELIKKEQSEEPGPAPRVALPLPNADPDDDLMCEIGMRPGFEPMPLPAPGEHAHALSAFTPADYHPREHAISRKLLAAGVVVVLAGLIWLGWCNHAPRAAWISAEPGSTVEQASAAGVLPDSAETGDASSNDSLRLLQEQAEAGDANAELALAVRYANGDGVWQSYPEALKWFTRAREEGVRVLRGPAAEAWRRVRWWAKSGHE